MSHSSIEEVGRKPWMSLNGMKCSHGSDNMGLGEKHLRN